MIRKVLLTLCAVLFALAQADEFPWSHAELILASDDQLTDNVSHQTTLSTLYAAVPVV